MCLRINNICCVDVSWALLIVLVNSYKSPTKEIRFTHVSRLAAYYPRFILSKSVLYLCFSCVWMNKLELLYKNAADIAVGTADTTSLTWAVNNFQQENFQQWRVPRQASFYFTGGEISTKLTEAIKYHCNSVTIEFPFEHKLLLKRFTVINFL